MQTNTIRMITLATAFLGAATASAHVTLESGEAEIGSSYKAVLRVPHGCAGEATTRLRLRIPDGFIGVKPMPKPGWEIDKTHGPHDPPHMLQGASITEGVVELGWSGNLPDDEYDEFIFRGTVSTDLEPGTMLYFPVIQECADGGVERWIEIPDPGKADDDLDAPAPGIRLLPRS